MTVSQLTTAVKGLKVVELGQYLEEKMPSHPAHSKFYKTVWHSHANGDPFLDHQLILNEHNGTHVDSFGHYINEPGYELIDKVPLSSFCGECVTIDAGFLKEHETLEKGHITAWEKIHGNIHKRDIVLLDFNWMQFWALRPKEYHFCHDFPGLGKTGAEYLVEKGVKMVGVDTLGVDADGAEGDPAHHELLSHRIPIVENLRNLSQLRGKRAYFVSLPLLIRDGSASPVRPIALIAD
jgi:kynurenine formamidase